jgi:hypothetical protein
VRYTDPSGHTIYLAQEQAETVSDTLAAVAKQIDHDLRAGEDFTASLETVGTALDVTLEFLNHSPIVGVFAELFSVLIDQLRVGNINWNDVAVLGLLALEIDDVAENSPDGVAIGADVGDQVTTFWVLDRSHATIGTPVQMRTSTFSTWFGYQWDLGQAYGNTPGKASYFVIDRAQSGSLAYNPWRVLSSEGIPLPQGAPACSAEPRRCQGQAGWHPGQDF